MDLVRRRLANRAPVRISEPGTIEAAVAIVLVPREKPGLEVLLIKRSEWGSDPWSGQMALPGGRREGADPSLLETAVREAAEETGVTLARGALLGELDDLHPRTPTLPPVVVRPFVFGLDRRPVVRPSDEVALHVWVGLTDLRSSATRVTVDVRGTQLEVDAFRIGPHVVWGMTHRILLPFIDLAS
jgi:8-oxo-dGTP pyrophosphatase MutT (NUDIX family)